MKTAVLLLGLCACTAADVDFGDDGPDDSASADTGLLETLPEGTCERWNAVRGLADEGSWAGSVDTCDAGDTEDVARRNTLLRVNQYRTMAGLPKVALDSGLSAKAQDCALMMFANNALDHNPPNDWACFTATGAEAAGMSNLSTSPGVTAVDGYMADWGNETTLGHRRWILSDGLGPIGTGSTSQHSCLWVIGGSGSDTTAWTAWPPPGEFPDEAASMLDATGWSLQSDGLDLSAASVTIRAGGVEQPIAVSQLQGGAGSAVAISMVPQGWTAQRGVTYEVEVAGVGQEIKYEVEILDCRG